MNITKDAMVIWEVKTGEADRVITLLSGDGILTAYARSSLKPNGRLTGPTAMLTYSNYELATGKNMFTVVDAAAQNRYLKIRSDPEVYALAVYFCELLKLLAPVKEDASDYLRLMMNSLYLLDSGSKPLWQVKAVFELTVMTLSGYMPDLLACSGCGAESAAAAYFDPISASWTCPECCGKLGLAVNVPFSAIKAMRYVVSSDPRRAFAFRLDDNSVAEFCSCCEQLVLNHIDHRLPTLEFYHSLSTGSIV